jgi:tRNA-dihydrouridine synthase B
MAAVLAEQLEGLYDLYGAEHGARIARKHIGWTVRGLPGGEEFRRAINAVVDAETQLRAVCDYFAQLAANDAGRETFGTQFGERLAA